jgi:hypothetical protein
MCTVTTGILVQRLYTWPRCYTLGQCFHVDELIHALNAYEWHAYERYRSQHDIHDIWSIRRMRTFL